MIIMSHPIRAAVRTLAFVTVCVLLVADSRAQGDTYRQLRHGVEAILQQEDFGSAFWGIEILDLEDDEVLYARNPTRALVPASTTKLATTAAALEWLGPKARLVTTLFADGPIEDGTLHGDLIVRGGGDPTIAEDLDEYGYAGLLAQWVDSVSAAGIRRIGGDVIGDDDVFDDVAYGPGWQWDDFPFYYSVEISGLSYNENVVDFAVAGSAEGSAGTVTWEPETEYVSFINASVTVDRRGRIEEAYVRPPGSNDFVIASRVPEGRVEREALAVHNPTRFFVHVLRERLESAGIVVDGGAVDVDDLARKPDYASTSMRVLARHQSPPVAEIAALVNKPSHNLAAESLLKTLGRIPEDEDDDPLPGSWERGAAVVRQTLGRAGVDTLRVRLVDGSGLSRLNLITPRAIGQLLAYMWSHPDPEIRDAFVRSLAVGGADGTLEGRFASGAAAGRVLGRTGTMTSVSALAAYVTRRGREPLVVVLIANNHLVPSRRVRQAQDDIVNLLARLSL